MRLDRMLGITLELMSKQRVTATELAAKFGVSVRTVYRDVELINQAGLPVVSFTGADGGFELMDGFFITRQQFSVDDLSVIYTLLKAMEGAMGGSAASAMRKLVSLHPKLATEESNEAVILGMSATDRERELLQLLYQAIRQSRVVELAYTSASGTLTERSVEPLNLLWEKGVWYLEAYCRVRQGKRSFRVSRMNRLEAGETTFTLRSIPDMPEQDDVPAIHAHLRFDRSVMTRVLEQFAGECTYQGDSIEVKTAFYSKEYALSLIASYGLTVEIVSPDELRDDIVAHMEAILHHFKKQREM